jgi:5-methylcytosine-specific restriction endonuclease McrA
MSKCRNGNHKRKMKLWKDEQYQHVSVLDCRYCGEPLTKYEATVDHIIPLDRGGKSENCNFGIACEDCNNSKGNMTEEEYTAFLKSHNRRKIPRGYIDAVLRQEENMERARKDSRYINVDIFFKRYKR